MQTKYILSEKEMPTRWYNVQADLPSPLPPVLHPITKQPVGPQDLAPLFPMAIIMQEVSTERYIDIPEEVQEIYKLWRPSPLYRAHRLERVLDTPAKIYYKYEGVSPAGSHKPNTAIAQAYYNKQEGVKRISTETGAGQWGSALALACNYFGLELKVYMVKVSYFQKPYRRSLIETWGAKVVPSPSMDTQAGRSILDQTVIGEESMKQMEMAGDYPDVVIGCVGGGSNFGGLVMPFVREMLRNGKKTRLVAVEPEACPTMTRGVDAYDFGDSVGMAPIVKMFTLGHTFTPPGIHAGGLRYHGMSPLISELQRLGLAESRAYHQNPVFDAAVQFARAEGIVPAPESAHAIRAAVDEALVCKQSGESKVILFGLSGHGHFDMGSYDRYFAGELEDYAYPEEKVKEALAHLPEVTPA